MINELLLYLLALVAGSALGALFLFLLWMQVRQLGARPKPGLSLLCGIMFRLALVTAVFFLILWFMGLYALLFAVLGFTLTRIVLVHYVLPQKLNASASEE